MGKLFNNKKSISNIHFRKKWHLHVKTWFNQKCRKIRRRKNRCKKVRSKFPNSIPLNLRPIVHGQTAKYNFKKKIGRGFTVEELKSAGINANVATTIGLTVDRRRRNRCREACDENVSHLQEFLIRLDQHPSRTNTTEECKNKLMATPMNKYIMETTRVNTYSYLRLERMKNRIEGKRKSNEHS
jgi:ribosomal protein L13E